MGQRGNQGQAGVRGRTQNKRVLAVQVMVGETAWLDGRLRWQGGRVVWASTRGPIAPSGADLALAQRRLNQIARYPRTAACVLGDLAAWRRGRLAQLALAKRLHTLAAPDLPALVAQVPDPAAIGALAALLPAEALCLNPLPAAPSAALLAAGPAAQPALQDLLADLSAPPAGRALAALVLGAQAHRQGSGAAPARPADPWLRRAYALGHQAGLPADAPLVVTLLADAGGLALARRYQAAVATPSPFQLPAEPLREQLAAGIAPAQVVQLAEQLAAAGRLATRLLQCRDPLPLRGPAKRWAVVRELRQARQQIVDSLAPLLRAYIQATADPGLVDLIVRFSTGLLALAPVTWLPAGLWRPHRPAAGPPGWASGDAILAALEQGLALPPSLYRPYLAILVDAQAQLWPPATFPHPATPPAVAGWLATCQREQVGPVITLLAYTQDAALVREAIGLGLHADLADWVNEWHDPGLCRWAVTLIHDLQITGSLLLHWLCNLLAKFASLRQARTVLGPLLTLLLTVPAEARAVWLSALSYELPDRLAELRIALPRLVSHLPRLIAFTAGRTDRLEYEVLVGAALAVAQLGPAQTAALTWLLARLAGLWRATPPTYQDREALRLGLQLGAALAAGDLGRWQAILDAALQHHYGYASDLMASSAAVLARYPALQAMLVRLFPRHPRRCLDLLVRVGAAARLDPAVFDPLAALVAVATDGATGAESPPPEWAPLLALAPDLGPLVAGYLRAQRILAGSPAVPPGVARALAQPAALARELAYLEARIAGGAARLDLALRVATLRDRLAAPDRLRALVREEVCDRLAQVTADAEIVAAERQVEACYRRRLEHVAGPLPPDLAFTPDLLNATLLTTSIETNRHLLLRLLRATLGGDRDWPRQHPANLAFLQAQAARGVDTAAWLGRQPRTYPCPGVAGGRVRLYLEHDPLRILQMGNYFDTCLSFGGINAFATVANACELNKRVIYAEDGTGRVLGRKLIAITATGQLVGFRTYSMLPEAAGAAALRAIFTHYGQAFAARCHLPLAADGPIPILFAEAWYDDGAVPWDDDPPPDARRLKRRQRRAQPAFVG